MIPKLFKNGVKRKPVPDITNWRFSALHQSRNVYEHQLPNVVSLKDKFPPVYSQIYGNCTSNAVLAVDAYYHHGASKLWVPSTTYTYYFQRIIDKAGFLEDDGSSVETALKAVRKYGACNSKVWPNDTLWSIPPDEKAYRDGLHGHEVSKYYVIGSILQIKKALAAGYPVVTSLTWAFKSYNKETYILNTPTTKEIKNCDCGHAVVIVGYNNKKELFEIRNSWGSSWGNDGYAYIPYDVMRKVIWYDDTYAVIK